MQKLQLQFLSMDALLPRELLLNTVYQGCDKSAQFRAIKAEMQKLQLKFLSMDALLPRELLLNTVYQGCDKSAQFRAIKADKQKAIKSNFGFYGFFSNSHLPIGFSSWARLFGFYQICTRFSGSRYMASPG